MTVAIARLEKIAADRVAELTKQIRKMNVQRQELAEKIEALNIEIDQICSEVNRVHDIPPPRPAMEMEKLREICEIEGKLNGIKYFKECTGLSLMDCKRAVEALAKTNDWKFHVNAGAPSFFKSAS